MAFVFNVEAFMAVALLLVDGNVCGWGRIRQACGTTCTSTTTMAHGGSCRDSQSATSMTVVIVIGGRAKLSKEKKLFWEVFCLVLGLDLQSLVEKSRAMVRATRADDVFDMLCPNQKTREVLTISTLGLLIAQIRWTILKKKKLDQRLGLIFLDAFMAHCVRLGENVNDFVERLVDEGALKECSGTGERCVHLETALAALHSCSGRAPLPCLLEALGQMYLECKQCCHLLRGALRAVEETVDDHVLTLAGLSSDLVKEKHLPTKSGRRRKLCEDRKKALTSELAAKWMTTENQPARIDDVDKALEGNLVQGDVGKPVCWLPHVPRSAWCLQLHGRWYEYCNGVANPGLWKSNHRAPNSCPNIVIVHI